MLLAVDIGNLYITIGAFSGDELLFCTRVESERALTADRYAVIISGVIGLHCDGVNISGAVMCSVVPELSSVVYDALFKLYGVKTMIVGPGVKTGLNIDIDNPAQLGADIVARTVGADGDYPMVVCDLGTATTLSVSDRAGHLSGVVICPGITSSLMSLTEHTALLPHISLDTPKSIIGKNTISSMRSGFLYGFASMIEGVVRRIEREIGKSVSVVLTGESAQSIARVLERGVTVDEHLLLFGLKKIYDRNKSLER